MWLKNFIIAVLSILTCLTAAASADAPELEYVLELKVAIGTPVDVGPTSHGRRVVIPITGGTFSGPDIAGIVLPGGADYQLVDDSAGRTELEAVYCIQTDDGINIHVRNRGLIVDNGSGTYFYAAPRFEAPSDSKYSWLNDALYVCHPAGFSDGRIILKVWRVCDSRH